MSKRSRTTPSPSTPKTKRFKVSSNQTLIDNFFNSPKSAVAKSILPAERGTRSESPKVPVVIQSETGLKNISASQIIDIDALDTFTGNQPLQSEDIKTQQFISSSSRRRIISSHATNSEKNVVFNSLSVDPVIYNPGSQPWPMSGASYAFISETLVALSRTRSRNTILDILTNALRTIIHHHPPSLLPSIYLLSNTLGPPFKAIELGIGPSLIFQSIQHISGLSSLALRQLYNATGDSGDVAFEAKAKVRTLIPHPPLYVSYVYESLLAIASTTGEGAAKKKQRIIEKLLLSAVGEEIRYLTRTLSQNLRVGAMRTSILTALARAMILTPPACVKLVEGSTSYTVPSEFLSTVNSSATTSKKAVTVDPAKQELLLMFSNAESLLKNIFCKHPSFDSIVDALLKEGLSGLAGAVPLTVGVPLLPTLGSPTRSLDEIYHRLGHLPFTAEYKYDGQRVQVHVHVDSGEHCIKLFSRHLEDMTTKYPDVVLLVQSMLINSSVTRSFIMDAEIVAVDPVTRDIKTFQELSNRARKDVQIKDVRISVCLFAFDLMYLDGESLLQRSFRERRNLLRQCFLPYTPVETSAARFDHVRSCESEDGKEKLDEFWESAIESRCEGLMIKLLDNGDAFEENNKSLKKSRRRHMLATYEPDKRTTAWLKLKKDYVTGLGDSLDLIPIGAWHGNGRKAQWWSPVLMGIWNSDTGCPVAVCKCMSGFTDVFYKAMLQKYMLTKESDTCSVQPLWECDFGGYKPDVYFRPHEVWEIRGADITESPVSAAALGLVSSRGLSVRFPRFLKTREDKSIDQATTPQFLATMWRNQQARIPDTGGKDEGDLIDVDIQSSIDGDSEAESVRG